MPHSQLRTSAQSTASMDTSSGIQMALRKKAGMRGLCKASGLLLANQLSAQLVTSKSSRSAEAPARGNRRASYCRCPVEIAFEGRISSISPASA